MIQWNVIWIASLNIFLEFRALCQKMYILSKAYEMTLHNNTNYCVHLSKIGLLNIRPW